jgi:hypothetical protein
LSIEESIEDKDETEKENEMAPNIISRRQNRRSGLVTPLISPKPTVVKVVNTKYMDAMYMI